MSDIPIDYETTKFSRKHNEIEEDNEPEIEPKKSKQSKDMAHIPSIIVKEVSDIVDDAKKLKKFIEKELKNVKVKRIKVTRNKNMQLYFDDSESFEEVLTNFELLDGKYRAIAERKLNYFILVGLNFKDVQIYKKDLENKYNIKEIKQIKSIRSPNQVINKVILAVEDKEQIPQLLKTGIYLNYMRFRTEEYKSPIRLIQCYKCQNYGHIAKQCNANKTVCPKCGKNDHEIDPTTKKLICNAEKKCCIHCKSEHSSAAYSCPKNQNYSRKSKKKQKSSYSTKIAQTIMESNEMYQSPTHKHY